MLINRVHKSHRVCHVTSSRSYSSCQVASSHRVVVVHRVKLHRVMSHLGAIKTPLGAVPAVDPPSGDGYEECLERYLKDEWDLGNFTHL